MSPRIGLHKAESQLGFYPVGLLILFKAKVAPLTFTSHDAQLYYPVIAPAHRRRGGPRVSNPASRRVRLCTSRPSEPLTVSAR
jgi:hypothetical protein